MSSDMRSVPVQKHVTANGNVYKTHLYLYKTTSVHVHNTIVHTETGQW